MTDGTQAEGTSVPSVLRLTMLWRAGGWHLGRNQLMRLLLGGKGWADPFKYCRPCWAREGREEAER